jgi:hypothetical protein
LFILNNSHAVIKERQKQKNMSSALIALNEQDNQDLSKSAVRDPSM